MARKTKVRYFSHGKLDCEQRALDYVREHCKPLRRYMNNNEPEHIELFELIEQMLDYEPGSRVTLTDALKHRYFDRLQPHERVQNDHVNGNGNSLSTTTTTTTTSAAIGIRPNHNSNMTVGDSNSASAV